jgi:hypothetical protein
MTTEPAHSELGASSAYRWMNCPGSIQAQRGKPDTAGFDAKLGTAAHAVLEQIFDANNYEPSSNAYTWLGEKVEGIEIDEETCRRVQFAVECVNTYYAAEVAEHGAENVFLLTETRVYLPHIDKSCFGTADIIIISPRRLIVFDYKNGSGVPVEIEKNGAPNPQLLYYGTGALLHAQKAGFKFESGVPASITIAICQPARGGLKQLTLSYDDLFDFGTLLSNAVKRTRDPNAPRVAGDWCKFCKAAGECEELREYAFEQTTAMFTARPDVVTGEYALVAQPARAETLPTDKLAAVLKAIPTVLTWAKATQDYAQRLAMSGVQVPGYKLVDAQGHSAWIGEQQAVVNQLIGYGFKPTDICTLEIKSPAQVKKLPLPDGMRRVQWEGIIGTLSARPERGVKLVPIDDTRPETTRPHGSPFTQEEIGDVN